MKNSKKQWVVFTALFLFSLACYTFLSTRNLNNELFVDALKLEKPETPQDLDATKSRHNFLFHIEMLKKLANGARKFFPASQF